MFDQDKQKAVEIYWLNKLSGELPRMALPQFEADEAAGSGKTQLQFEIAEPIFEKLNHIAGNSGKAMFILVLSGLNIALHKYTGSEDLLVGTISPKKEGRKDNLVFCRSSIDTGSTFKETITRVKETVLKDFDYVDYSFGILYQKLLANRDADSLDIFRLAFIYDKFQNKSKLLNQYDLVIVLSNEDGKAALKVEYKADLYTKKAVELFFKNLINLFDNIAAKLDMKIEELDIVGPEEKGILHEFNETGVEFPLDKTIYRLFEEQVERSPDQTAVVFKDRHVTYGTLNEKANRLARYLRKQGVKSNRIVGLMMERSLEIVVGMLAILKAGGAYLPIDAKMPRNRIIAMLKDSSAAVLLTQNSIMLQQSFSALQELSRKKIEPYYTPPRQQITDLDQLPVPDRSLVDLEKFNRYIGQVMVKDIISLQTARGCPYNCSYCSKIWHKKHVFRSAGHVFEEMKMYYDMGVRRFSIFDDIFNVNIANSSKFFELIIKNNLDVQLFFPNGLRGDLLTKDYIDLLVEAGLVCTALALETASPRLQKLINKNLKLDIFRENAEYFCKKYPQVVLELFSMHGFPTETEAEARLTLDFIKSMKWLHFPYVFILKVYPGTEMADLAMEHGVRREDIFRSEDLAFHDLSPTSPFKKSFTKNYQSEFLNEYFLSKERLLHVLPYQLKVFTQDEIIQKYDSYLPADIKTFSDLLKLADIDEGELNIEPVESAAHDNTKRDSSQEKSSHENKLSTNNRVDGFIPDDHFTVPDLNKKIREVFPVHKPAKDALRVLFLDLSQFFTGDTDMLYDVVEPPLGGMYVMTYLKEQLGEKVAVKILKSRIDFDSYAELKELLVDFDPQVIGIRSLTFYRDFYHRTIQVLRQWGIDVPIIAGGPYATRNYDSILQDRNIDLLVTHEGETTFCEIIEKIIENGGQLPGEPVLKEIAGIGFVPGSRDMPREFARQIILADELSDATTGETGGNLQPVNGSSDLAYIIFTSGSTGKPKGVLTEQRNVVNTLSWFARRYDLHKDVHVLQLSNYTFDPSVEQIFATLLNGATVFIPDDLDIIADREVFRNFVERHRINIINFVPGTLKDLLGSGERLKSLNKVISGGEKLDQPVNNRIIEKGYELHNHYGPTEITVDALAETCSTGNVTLGKPISNASCYILQNEDHLAPIGVAGELCIGGAGVARGYLNRPELTTEKFNKRFLGVQGAIFQKSPLGKLYKTGDLARWLPDGKIEFLGRIDHQVKIRGFRIELGEIEAELLKHKEIKEAVVTANEDQETADKYLCAYYTVNGAAQDSGSPEAEVDAGDLRQFLSETLPDYMVPAYFMQLDRIPLNANKKIDRSALPEPTGAETAVDYEAPRNDTEEILAGIWSEVLGNKNEQIGIDNNFFEIGGDSIKVIQISAKLRKFGLKLESGDLFLNPTIRQLGGCIKSIKRNIDQGLVTGEVKLSPVQRWFFTLSNTGNISDKHHYNLAVMLHSTGGFEKEAVQAVFSKLQEHHDTLRTTFREENGDIIQEIHGIDYPLSLEEFDFRQNTDGKQAAESLLNHANELQKSIDLAQGPLMKLGLFHLPDGDRLLIVVHHLVIDGISWRILFEDIETLYRQYKQGEDFVLPLKTDSFQYWCERLSEYADSEAFLSEEKEYWAQLEAAPVEEIDKDFDAPNLRKDTRRMSTHIDEEETELLLTDVNKAFGTEINDILLTALLLGFRHTFAKDRILVALEGHGRENFLKDIDISRTVGWFTSVYPVLLEAVQAPGLPAEEVLGRQIKEVKEKLHLIPNRGVGCGILNYLTSPENKKGIEFKLQPRIGFNYLGQFDADVETRSFGIAKEPAGRIQSPEGENEFDLDISGMIADKKLRISAAFSKRQFKDETIKTLLDHFKKELVNIISYCAGREDKELTPSDLAYKDLSIDELDTLFD